jgi:hypothetical protein
MTWREGERLVLRLALGTRGWGGVENGGGGRRQPVSACGGAVEADFYDGDGGPCGSVDVVGESAACTSEVVGSVQLGLGRTVCALTMNSHGLIC